MPQHSDPIHVTLPALAPLEEVTQLLEGVWSRGILTHNGPLVQQLERDLCATLGLPGFVAMTSGTVALQAAIKALDLAGEIVTTPFTWIATVSAIQWQGCTPVFCDIDPDTLNLDPDRLEEVITERTVAIMPVHVFGNPCDVSRIQAVADQYGLKVIYDAAHAVGSTFHDRSLLNFGDVSATSLHATKILNTGEGGGCVAREPAIQDRLKRLRFFGYDDQKDVVEQGFNGKMTEVHAAVGIANLRYFNDILADRKRKYQVYREALEAVPRLRLQTLRDGDANCSYFPVVFEHESLLLETVQRLQDAGVFPRRYFYPSVNTYNRILPFQAMPISEDIAKRILCLPLHWQLSPSQQTRIIDIVRDSVLVRSPR